MIEGYGSFASLYRVWRRGFDGWLAASGECPKPDRLYVRFPSPARTAAEPDTAAIALFIPLEDIAPPRSRVAANRH